jgi:hypothetical protein
MIQFKGKGEHSVNELEQIILEQNEIIHQFRSKEAFHPSFKYGKSEDRSKSCKLYPCSIGDWHADFDKELCINCDKYVNRFPKIDITSFHHKC